MKMETIEMFNIRYVTHKVESIELAQKINELYKDYRLIVLNFNNLMSDEYFRDFDDKRLEYIYYLMHSLKKSMKEMRCIDTDARDNICFKTMYNMLKAEIKLQKHFITIFYEDYKKNGDALPFS